MTVQNPAVFLQSEAHPAEDVRRMFTALAGSTGGVVDSGALAVSETAGAASMGVDVAGGRAWIAGSEATYQGLYFVENRGVEALTIGSSDPTNGRYDLIVAKIEDSAYSGSVNAWSLVVVAGTADPSPVDPATPANSITLARVTVGAGVSTITNANITDLRSVVPSVPSLVEPTGFTLASPLEEWTISATAATGTVDVDVLTTSTHYYTSDASANWTYNFRGDASNTLDSLLAVGESISVVHAVTNGVTAYYPTAFTVDSSAVTPKWSGGAAPAGGNASSVDVYLFTIIKTAGATFTVLGQQVQFA